MLFNSIDFALFLPIVFIVYWFVCQRNLRLQNFFIVVASYIFYGWWDVRFLGLLLFSTLIDFLMGLKLAEEQNERKRKLFLFISIFTNLGLLAFFKYCDFFIENFAAAFTFFDMPIRITSLNIILPVGISFYTFQTMSYTIDVYLKKLEPTKDFISFTAFVSFFPQLVAGPIERATHLLPQFYVKRKFDYSSAINGSKQILWGFFKKMVIADNCAFFADMFFNNSSAYPGSSLLLGAFFFTFQIYGDFSGYSDIAIGSSRLFGFELMQNFAYPYFSRDIAEFWRKWHISLTTWFRDYVYIPLGGNRGGVRKKIINISVVFFLSGLWHGAKWTFVVWGLLHAAFFLPLAVLNKTRLHIGKVAPEKKWPGLKEGLQMLTTFLLVVLLWIFFRAENMSVAIHIFKKIFSASLLEMPKFEQQGLALVTLVFVLLFTITEWMGRKSSYAIEDFLCYASQWKRWSFYALILTFIGVYMKVGGSPFIYFQF